MKKEKLFYPALIMTPTLLAYLLSFGKVFGSKLDWLSQHVLIADYLRHSGFYASQLQAGTSIYSFSYYGLFRPDVLISRLFLHVDMRYFIISYSVLLWTLTGLFCFQWLKEKGYKIEMAFFVSMLCMLSNCFFHTHQQVMFVEILPFLFLSFLLIDRQKKQGLCFCIFLAMIHNYFYTPGFLVMLCLYNYIQDHTLKDLFIPILLGIGMSCILWLPTGLIILENKKSVQGTNLFELLIPNLSLKNFLYDPYGCGLTALSWIALFQGLSIEKTKKLSFLLILIFLFPIFSYLLNGTLYARSKILVLCLPFVLWILCEWLIQRRISRRYVLISCIFLIGSIKLDLLVTLIFLYFYIDRKKDVLMIYLLVPFVLFVSMNTSYLSQGLYAEILSSQKEALLNRNTLNQRTADLDHIYLNSNHVYNKQVYRASSYTSTSNTLYNTWFYDVIKNPVSQTNRTVLADSENYLYLSLMGIENVLVKKDNLYGYQKVDQEGKYKLLKNKNIFPLAYVTQDCMNEKNFKKESYPYTLDTVYNRTIVKKGKTKAYSSKMQLVKSVKKKRSIHSKKKIKKRIQLDFDTNQKMLCIDFDVRNKGKQKVWIQINGMKNTLSKKDSVYPNGNHHFTYVLSKKKLKSLNVIFSRGNYDLSHLRIYTCPMSTFSRKVQKVKLKKTTDVLKGVVSCSSGVFVTSIPYEKGYELYIDGKKEKIEIVNTAFIGARVHKGKHTIVLKYKTPGQDLSVFMSSISLLLGGFYLWKESKNSFHMALLES